MPIPEFQAVMLPLLEALADGREHVMRDLNAQLADHFKLTKEEREQRMAHADNKLFVNRVGWAKAHLKAAGLLENPAHGRVRLSNQGRKVLDQKPATINLADLRKVPSYLADQKTGAKKPSGKSDGAGVDEGKTPQERIDAAYETHCGATVEELLSRLRACPPAFFEKAVLKLLRAMRYGGERGEGLVTGKSGDGGIDGVITEDKLGLDVVCVQAKRWEATVGRPVVQGFVGSMDAYRARKGVVLTTSSFSHEAVEYVTKIEGKKVILIDGERLAELMLEHGVGVETDKVYELKKVSNDFFDEDEG
jgi:restriction system protein